MLGPVSVRKPPWFPDECRALRHAAAGAKEGSFAGSFSAERGARVLLAMQKVEGFESLQPLPLKPARKAGVGFCAADRRRSPARS